MVNKIKILKNYDITKLNTFGVSAGAKYFVEIKDEEELMELLYSEEFKNNKRLFLGGGSNVLFMNDFDGIIILNSLKGISIVDESEKDVRVRAMGGEIWHDLVAFCSKCGYWGIENLSLIPGTVGAAPMQNIGAYGVELKDTLESVEAYDIEIGKKRYFEKEECEFGYRDSIFKNSLKGKYFISAILLKLSKVPKKNVTYKILSEYLKKNNIKVKNPGDISHAVANIRRSKLPNPQVIGNAGSFFKNVFVEKQKLNELLQNYPEVPYFNEDGMIKIPAGWLIEQCGWKGKRVGNTGVHEKQALVLVNHGGATGKEIKDLADMIIKSVYEKFELELFPEVNLI